MRFKIKRRAFPTLSWAACSMVIGLTGLTGVLAAELVDGAAAQPASDSAAVPAAPRASMFGKPVALPEADAAAAQRLVTTILERPLFSPGRRPAALAAAPPQDAGPPPDPVKLVGTIVSTTFRVAFLEIADKRVTRRLGDSVGSDRIIEIDPTFIRVRAGDGQSKQLLLTRGTPIAPVLQPSLRPFHVEE